MRLFVGDNIPDPKHGNHSPGSRPSYQGTSLRVWKRPFMAPQPKNPTVRQAENGVTFKVRVQPKASRNQVDGFSADSLRLRVTAPPQDGKANLAVISLLAETLGVPKSRLRIIRGHASREKLVEVTHITREDLDRALNAVGS